MGAELFAWRPVRLVVILALVTAMAIAAARWGGVRCGHEDREPGELVARIKACGPPCNELTHGGGRSGLRIRPPTWIMDDICGSLAELPAILAFDESRMQRFCRVLRR